MRFLKSVILKSVERHGGLTSLSLDRKLLGYLKFGFNPPANKVRYPGGATGACVISIDFDHLTKSPQSTDSRWFPEVGKNRLLGNRIGTRDLLRVSEKYSIPMTWAICGQTAQEDRPTFTSVLESKQAQEIGVHTYSHIDVAGASESDVETDIQKCLDVLNLDSPPKSFIFPWNRMGHFELLRKMGFITYRDQQRAIQAPTKHQSLLNIAPTYYIDQNSYGAQGLMKRYLDLCISWNSVFHLWLHPWSAVLQDDDKGRFVNDTFDPFFSYIAKKRDSGLLSVCTMGELATFLEDKGANLQTTKVLATES